MITLNQNRILLTSSTAFTSQQYASQTHLRLPGHGHWCLNDHSNGPQGATDYSYVGPLIDDSTGFSKDQIDQVQQANSDAVRFCQTAIEAKGNETFNHVFQKYFHIDDRDFVVSK